MNIMVRRLLIAVVLMCVITASAACYGPFNLTRNVYDWNSNVESSGEVNSKWMREIVFSDIIGVRRGRVAVVCDKPAFCTTVHRARTSMATDVFVKVKAMHKELPYAKDEFVEELLDSEHFHCSYSGF